MIYAENPEKTEHLTWDLPPGAGVLHVCLPHKSIPRKFQCPMPCCNFDCGCPPGDTSCQHSTHEEAGRCVISTQDAADGSILEACEGVIPTGWSWHDCYHRTAADCDCPPIGEEWKLNLPAHEKE